jgi:hypothetical protein
MNPFLKNFEEKLKKLSNELTQLRIPIPQQVFFSSWSLYNPIGRDALFYKLNEGSGLIRDDKTSRIAQAWLYAFPDHREDFIIERSWQWMQEKKDDKHTFDIIIVNNPSKLNTENGQDKLPSKIGVLGYFLKALGGVKNGNEKVIRTKIEEKIKGIGSDIDDYEAYITKVARLLRYDPDFNELHLKGIRSGFKVWAEKENVPDIDPLFKQLYHLDSGSPLDNPDIALDFLFMWQSLSITFPDFEEVMMFLSRGSNARYVFVLSWDKRLKDKKAEIIKNSIPNELQKIQSQWCEIGKNIVTKTITSGDKSSNTSNSNDEEDKIWPLKGVHKQNWNDRVVSLLNQNFKHITREQSISERTDPIMELVGRLAFSRHEGHPLKYAFIIGSEQIWPVIAEIISFVNYKPNQQFISPEVSNKITSYYTESRFNLSFLEEMCKANYSLFQIPRVLGHYNIVSSDFNKIVRLKEPSHEEKLERSIIDLDDYFCWVIRKIKKSPTGENAIIVETEGDGIVRIYGLPPNEYEEGELILIWNVSKRSLELPISSEKSRQIEKAIELIGINNGKIKTKITKRIKEVIRKISGRGGQGAALIFTKELEIVKPYITTMEILPIDWLRTLDLQDPEFILKAAFIMDGASLVINKKIWPRLVIYPFAETKTEAKAKAWGIPEILEEHSDNLNDRHVRHIIEKLSGKGSKTHGSANLSTLKMLNAKLEDPKLMVISISADGDINVWPQELLVK